MVDGPNGTGIWDWNGVRFSSCQRFVEAEHFDHMVREIQDSGWILLARVLTGPSANFKF